MNHITFSYGGRYSYNEDDIKWHPKIGQTYMLYKVGGEGFCYQNLVDRILHKVKAHPSTILRLSHFTYGITPKDIIYIKDDDDAWGFVGMLEGAVRILLHVEVVLGVVDDQNSRAFANIGEFVSDGTANRTVVAENSQDVHCDHDPPDNYDPSDNYLPLENYEAQEQFEALEHRETVGIVPDSPSDVDECADDTNQAIDLEWDDGIDMAIGQEFESKKVVQDLVERAMHQNCFNVFTDKSTKTLLVLKCRGKDCKWSVRAAKRKGSERFSIRTYNKRHTCSRVTTSTSTLRRKGSSRLVASVIHQDYPQMFDTPRPKQLGVLVKTRLGLDVSYTTLLRGKKLAISDVRGSPEESFSMFPSYLHMLEEKNDGTVTRFVCDEQQRFKYLFFALGACIKGFQVMRKVIIIDGTFLKSGYGGVLIVATAQDPDHHHYPIAFGVVDGEKDDSWRWFLEMLKTVVPDHPGLVIVSDRHSSIIKSVCEVFPNAKHGYCIWHLSQNVKAHVSGANKEIVAQKFRECAQVYTEAEFKEKYTAFRKAYPKAGEYLDGSVSEMKWARCYFPGERYNIDTTNCAESLNSVFRDARKYSLLPMIDVIVGKIVDWFNKYRRIGRDTSMEHRLVPYVANVLHKRCEHAKLLGVKELNSLMHEYYVTSSDGKKNFYVDLSTKRCTCKRFDIDRYPCDHAIAASMLRARNTSDVDLHEYCSPYYFIEQWVNAYSETIYPVPDSAEWNIPVDIAAIRVFPPKFNINRGRRREARFPSAQEPRRKSQRGRGRGRGIVGGILGDG